MDQGIRIVWYDLPEDKKKDYINLLDVIKNILKMINFKINLLNI